MKEIRKIMIGKKSRTGNKLTAIHVYLKVMGNK